MVWRNLHISETGSPASELYKEPQSNARNRLIICTSGLLPNSRGKLLFSFNTKHPCSCFSCLTRSLHRFSSRPVSWVSPFPAVLTRDTDTPNVIDNSSTMATQSHLTNSPASSVTGEPVEPQPHHKTPSFSPGLAMRCDNPQRTEMGHPSSSHKKGKVIGRNREKRQLDKARPAAVGTHDPKWELNSTKKRLLTALYVQLNGIYALSPA